MLLAWGGFAAAYSAAGRVLRSIGRRGSVVAGPRRAGRGRARSTPTATTGRSRSRSAACCVPPVPASALVLAGVAPLLALIAITGDGASWPLAGAVVAWLVLLAGASAGRPLRDRLRWVVPPALRVAEYAGLLWIAALAGPSSVPAAFALLLAITYRHYDMVYRLRHRGDDAAALAQPRRGRLGRAGCSPASRSPPRRSCPPASGSPRGCFAAVVVGESVHGWATATRTREPDVYEDEEEVAE